MILVLILLFGAKYKTFLFLPKGLHIFEDNHCVSIQYSLLWVSVPLVSLHMVWFLDPSCPNFHPLNLLQWISVFKKWCLELNTVFQVLCGSRSVLQTVQFSSQSPLSCWAQSQLSSPWTGIKPCHPHPVFILNVKFIFICIKHFSLMLPVLVVSWFWHLLFLPTYLVLCQSQMWQIALLLMFIKIMGNNIT